jgi:hypothetical protein
MIWTDMICQSRIYFPVDGKERLTFCIQFSTLSYLGIQNVLYILTTKQFAIIYDFDKLLSIFEFQTLIKNNCANVFL